MAVFPTFKGFRAAIASETRTAGQSGGKAFDSAFKAATANTAANVTKGLEAQVKAATQALSKARLAEADALGGLAPEQAGGHVVGLPRLQGEAAADALQELPLQLGRVAPAQLNNRALQLLVT